MTATGAKEDTTDLFGSSVEFKNHWLKIHLDYNITTYGAVSPETKLKIELKPEAPDTSYLGYPSSFTQNKSVIADNGDKLADVNISSDEVSAELTFPKELNQNFTIDLNSSLQLNTGKLSNYFNANPDKQSLEQPYYLYLNGEKQDKRITFIFPKPKPAETKIDFFKTLGYYKRDGELGEGIMYYNIKVGTKLRKSNEFFIYDTPDVNLSFEDSSFSASYATGTGNKSKLEDFFNVVPDGCQKTFEGSEESRMEVQLYDIYFLTAEATSPSQPRQAAYEDQTLYLNRFDIKTQKQGMYSMDTAAVPKNILVEKNAGEALTTEEKAKIDQAGGLNKTVGKGFKFHIKNFKQDDFEEGGFFTLYYEMKIVNPSQSLDKNQNPLYYNTASYYAQEIPNCNPNDTQCTPIQSEKTKLEDVAKGNYTTEAVVKEGEIGGTIDEYTIVEFTKQNEEGNPLAGATFTIYQSDENKTKGQVAVNKANQALENLVTNEEGKLCVASQDGSKTLVTLNLKRGYYLVSEIAAPQGYEKGEDVFLTVGFKAAPVIFTNSATSTPPVPTPETISILVTKTWQDDNNKEAKRPNNITIKLIADDQQTEKALVLNEDNHWKDSFKDLAKNSNGKAVKYTIEEMSVEGYTTTIKGDMNSGFEVINSYKSGNPNPTVPKNPTNPGAIKPDHPQPFKPDKSTTIASNQLLIPHLKNTNTPTNKQYVVIPRTGEDPSETIWSSILLLTCAAFLFVVRNRIKA